MAVIVRHNESNKRYVLVGAGFGAYTSARPSLIFGSLLPTEDEGTLPGVALCDEEGRVEWVRSEEVTVLSVDGEAPADLLAG